MEPGVYIFKPDFNGRVTVDLWGAGQTGGEPASDGAERSPAVGGASGAYVRLNDYPVRAGRSYQLTVADRSGRANRCPGGDTSWVSPSVALAPGGGSGNPPVGTFVLAGKPGTPVAGGVAPGGGVGGLSGPTGNPGHAPGGGGGAGQREKECHGQGAGGGARVLWDVDD